MRLSQARQVTPALSGIMAHAYMAVQSTALEGVKKIMNWGKHTVAASVMASAALVGCGGGGSETNATPGTPEPTAPVTSEAPATHLSFAGGATITLDNAGTHALTFATSKPTTAQTPVVLSSSSAAVVPILSRDERGQYTLRAQVVGSHQGPVTINIKIGDEITSVTLDLNSILRISDTSTVLANIGSTPRTYTYAEFLALFPVHENVSSIEVTSPNIVDANNPNKILATVTQDKDKGTITVTPMRSGSGTIPVQMIGAPFVQQSPQLTPPPANMAKKNVIVPVSDIASPTTSLSVNTSTAYISSDGFRTTVASYNCMTMEGTSCVPVLGGVDAERFEIYGGNIIIRGYVPSGHYQLTLKSGDKSQDITVISQDPAPVDNGGGGGGTVCPPGTSLDPTGVCS